MYHFKMRTSVYFIIIVLTLYSCNENYDSQLQTPDIDEAGLSHGYNLTPLGCLLYSPLTCDEWNNGYNIQILKGNKKISEFAAPYSDLQKQLVFQLQKNGAVYYWFKKDYLKLPVDTTNIFDGQKSLPHTIYNADQLKDKLKHIYTNGKWTVNFKDSTLKIDFGQNDFSDVPLEGKYTKLGAGNMSLQQTVIFDSMINGKKEIFKKNINTTYESY